MRSSPRWMSTIETLLGAVSRLCIAVAGVALVILVVTFGWLVFGRYVLNVTPTWVEQLALVLVCYIAFLGAAAGIHERTHLGVTLFRDALGKKPRQAVIVFCDLLLAGFGGIMFVTGLELYAFGMDTLLPMLNVPESVRSASAVICGGLVFIFAGTRAVLSIIRMALSIELPEEEAA